MDIDLSGEVEVQTTIGTRKGVPVVIQTKTVSITGTENGVTRRELHVVETEQPLIPLLRAEQARRNAAQQEAFNRAFERDLLPRSPRGGRPADRVDTVQATERALKPDGYRGYGSPFPHVGLLLNGIR